MDLVFDYMYICQFDKKNWILFNIFATDAVHSYSVSQLVLSFPFFAATSHWY